MYRRFEEQKRQRYHDRTKNMCSKLLRAYMRVLGCLLPKNQFQSFSHEVMLCLHLDVRIPLFSLGHLLVCCNVPRDTEIKECDIILHVQVKSK
jgi:hypothetical protein